MITRSDIAKRLEYGVKPNFLLGGKNYTAQYLRVARVVESTGKEETFADLVAPPMPREMVDEVTPRGFGEVSVKITNKKFELTIAVDHDAINDDRVGDFESTVRSTGRRFEQHKDSLVFKALNAGDGSTYGLCYDGLSYFNTAHVHPKGSYQTAQSNKSTLALSWANFNTAWVNANGLLDSEGEQTAGIYDLLVVPPALKSMAHQISDNAEKAGTGDRDKNPFSGEVQYIVSKYLDSTAWILVASQEENKPIILQIRQEPEFIMWDDNKKDIRYFKWEARWNVGYADMLLAYMGNT